MKSFSSVEDTFKRIRRQTTEWDKTLGKQISEKKKKLVFKIYKELLTFKNKYTSKLFFFNMGKKSGQSFHQSK